MKNLIKQLRNPKVFKPLLIAVVIVVIVASYTFSQMRTGRVFIDDSLVSAPVVNIVANTPGTLSEIDAYEGQYIKKGDSLGVVAGQAVYADTDGLIVMANNQIGSNVTATSPLVQMINPQNMRIAGTIDENKGLSDVRVGQVVNFTVDALPGKVFWGYVDEVSPTAKQTQAAFSISSERPTQQFVVYATFDANRYPAVKNGMSAKMTIFTSTH